MKTEKRLTMALSVLVALMMLAVPLASSSNLFVDGGQTNSNGDAPSLGAAGDTLTINLNIPENSLDTIDYDALKNDLSTTNIIYSVDAKNGVIRAICNSDEANKQVQIKTVLDAIKTALGSDGRMAAYDLTFSGDYTTVEENIEGQITANAVWKLKNAYGEVSIITKGLGEDSEKIKAYKYVDDSKKTELTIDVLPTYLKTAGNGYVVNLSVDNEQPVYTYIVTDSKGNKVDNGSTIESGSILTATYTFDSLNYGTIFVNSPIFDNAVTFYVAKTTGALEVATTTYWMVFNALISEKYLMDVKDSSTSQNTITKLEVSTTFKLPLTANEGSCKINSWTNGSEDYALNSNSIISIGSELILNAEFTTFPVKFMVNGQVQTVDVKYGEFSEASCPFDTTGMTVWVSENAGTKTIFNFDRSAEDLQKELVKSTSEKTLTLIALFSAYDETAYVTFNAGTDAYFGDKKDKITEVIVPVAIGTTADKIPVPVNPTSTDKSSFFAFWTEPVVESARAAQTAEYKFTSSVIVDESIELTAEYIDYAYSITLKVSDDKYMVIYLSEAVDAGASISDNVSGVEFDGKVYTTTNIKSVSENETLGSFITKNILPSLSGYNFIQYNDSDGNRALNITMDASKNVTAVTSVSKIGANVEFDAVFEAAEYVIIYSGNTAAATNNMVQVGTVGEPLNFFSDATFSNDGYKLKEWNTRPDGKGTSYALGSSFTLSGEDYDKLSKVSDKNGNIPTGIDHGFTLYAIWEKSSSGSGSGDNNEGNDGNNTDTYLLAGILAVIIILIILIAFLMRRKN